MRTTVLTCFTLALAGARPAAAGGASPAPRDPLDLPDFTAAPADLLAAAKRTPAGDSDVALLRDDLAITIDDHHRMHEHYRLVFAVATASAVDDWGTIGLDFAPFYQEPPVVHARVIGPGGDVAELDPSLVHDAPSVSDSPTVFSDRRDVSAPLPRLAIGAVVEETFEIVDREPLLAAGATRSYGLVRDVPIAREVVTISSPTALGARVVTRGPALAVKPQVRTAGGRTTVTYDLHDVAAEVDRPPGAPSDWLANPMIEVGTGASWAAIADGYRALVDERLARPASLPADLRGPTPRATIDRVSAWLHAHVRYTGIELSDSAIVPAAPGDTLARGFGDCKDQATLLVALLRASGVTADVALLATGPGYDTDPELPGMGGFDHAIVRAVVDGKDVWIDATEDLLPPGQLPSRDQGRAALVIAAGTRGLTRIPLAPPADNLLREVRTYQLAEAAAAHVVELTQPQGTWIGTFRATLGNTSHKELEQDYRGYVDHTYQGTLATFSHSDPRDLATPITLTIEASDVGRTGFRRDSLYAWLFPSDALDQLPDVLSDTGKDTARDAADRKADFAWSTPYVREIVNRLELPPGYSPPDLPAHEVRAIGTMTLTTTRERTADSITITYRLDTGKTRITADELRATRAAVAAIYAEGGQQVILNLDAATLKHQGKLKEAIAEYRRLIALHPTEALHHGQLALAYLSTGLGDAARREARLATTIEPGDGDAWMVLGHVLSRDLVGRLWRPGADRAGAEAAYRKALALLPTHVGARDDLVQLLTTDDEGRPATDLGRLREAIALLRAPEGKNVEDHDGKLVALLGRAGDADGLAELARTLPDGHARQLATVMVSALRDGGDAALRQADSLVASDQRDALVDSAAELLVDSARYDIVRPLRKATNAAAGAQLLATFDRLHAIDLAHLAPADPLTPTVLALARAMLEARPSPPWGREAEEDLAQERRGVDPILRAQPKIPATALFDFSMAAMAPTVEGNAADGWRIVYTAGGTQIVFYVALERGRAVLLGGNGVVGGAGRSILDALHRHDLARARRLAGYLATDLVQGYDQTRAFLHRHAGDLSTASAPMLELIGAMMLNARAPAEAAPIIHRCAGLTDDDDLADCERVASAAYVAAGAFADAFAEVQAYAGGHPGDHQAMELLAELVERTGKPLDGVRAQLGLALLGAPDDAPLRYDRAVVAIHDGWAAARPQLAALVAPADADPTMLNNVAWDYLYYDPTPDEARATIERAVVNRSDASPFALHTYAAVLAESDQPFAAWQRLDQALAGRPDLDDDDWYVIGRIAEGYGLTDDARAAYARVGAPKGIYLPPSGWDFAQRHLKAMGPTAGRAPAPAPAPA
ncbi:MAG TPA: DUF3857 domain-containing protein, partial [Kofleriaceae bacterium]|nr:DUF3857 domain-containing protein [Kofleriaceae bacterium]